MGPEAEVLPAAIRCIHRLKGHTPTPAQTVDLLVDNQVPLLSLLDVSFEGNSPAAAVRESTEFAHEASVQRLVYEEVHGNFERVARRWEDRGIQAICFKSAGIAPSYPYTSENFDILFKSEDEPGVREVLTDLGYVLLANCDEPQKWLYRLFVAGKSVSAIHVHTRVGWGQGFMLEADIWKRARPSADDPVTWVPGAEDVILINAAHSFFENKAFGLHDLMKVRRAIGDGVNWEIVEGVARERGWLSSLQFAIAMMGELEARLFETQLIPTDRIGEPVSANSAMQAQLEGARRLSLEMPFPTSWRLVKNRYFDKIIRDRAVTTREKGVLVSLTLARGLKSQLDARPQNSGLYTLSGVDGSGKTAQAEALSDAFDVCHLRRRVMWARIGATPVMYRLSRLWAGSNLHGKNFNASAAHESTRTPASPMGEIPGAYGSGPIQSELTGSPSDGWDGRPGVGRQGTGRHMVWAMLSSLDFAAWLFRIRWRLVRGDIIIADRYLCDYDVELSIKLESADRFRRALLGILKFVAPPPSRAFLLEVNVDTASKRATPDGKDFDPAVVVAGYRERADGYGLSRIDATRSFEIVSGIVEREALRSYFNRYSMLGNFFFFQNPWQLNRPVRKQAPETDGGMEALFIQDAPHIVWQATRPTPKRAAR